MCQFCEMGLDRWVDDPLYGVMLSFGQEAPAFDDRKLVQVWFRESESVEGAWEKVRVKAAELETFAEQYQTVGPLFWEVRKFESGYWTG